MPDGHDRWTPVDRRESQNLLATTVFAAAVGLGLFAGTGGHISQDYVLKRLLPRTGSTLQGSASHAQTLRRQGLSVELDTIRSALRLSVAELAQLFGVSRPTIYNWQNGSSVTEQHAVRLRAIASALEPHLALFETQPARFAHRAVDGRSTLLQLLQQRHEPRVVIQHLTSILQKEAAQRARLASRLQGRSAERGVADFDTLG